jgi:hypothetical protein
MRSNSSAVAVSCATNERSIDILKCFFVTADTDCG